LSNYFDLLLIYPAVQQFDRTNCKLFFSSNGMAISCSWYVM